MPDVMFCDEKGDFHFIELKATAGRAVELSPHQVAWISKHQRASVWVAVMGIQTKKKPQKFYLFHGSKAVDLRMEGLDKVEPDYESEWPPNWEDVLDLISPK